MEKLQWEIFVPIFRNPFILKGLGVAIGMPFGILIVVLLLASNGDVWATDVKFALILIGLLLFLTFIFVMIYYRGNYAPGFIVDDDGVTNYTQEKQAKKNKLINTLLIVLGALSLKPTTIGIGINAQSRQVVQLRWKNIRAVQFYPKKHVIIVKGGYLDKIAIFCLKDNYIQVETMIKTKLPQLEYE